jgi:FkbM family methyltransferase
VSGNFSAFDFMWRNRIKAFSYFSPSEIFQLLIGKLYSGFKYENFELLQDTESKLNLIISNSLSFKIENELINFIYPIHGKNYSFSLRLAGSDVFVFNQVILSREYEYAIELFRRRFNVIPRVIVDAGANIGMTIIYFKASNPESHIWALEPDDDNFEMARKNIELNSLPSIILNKAALWPTKQRLQLVNDFRDKKDWSLRVEESKDGNISSFTPGEIISQLGSEIDFFKIDIEGGESNLFSSSSDLSWLTSVKMIAMEIHDEISPREKIINELKKFNFDISHQGELVVGVNTLMKI